MKHIGNFLQDERRNSDGTNVVGKGVALWGRARVINERTLSRNEVSGVFVPSDARQRTLKVLETFSSVSFEILQLTISLFLHSRPPKTHLCERDSDGTFSEEDSLYRVIGGAWGNKRVQMTREFVLREVRQTRSIEVLSCLGSSLSPEHCHPRFLDHRSCS